MFKRLFTRTKVASVPVIIVGTDYLSYQLGDSLNKQQQFVPLFFINQEPWHHRTTMLGAELRYENELIALVKHFGIRAVCCVEPTDYQRYQTHFADQLHTHHCKLLFSPSAAELPSLFQATSSFIPNS